MEAHACKAGEEDNNHAVVRRSRKEKHTSSQVNNNGESLSQSALAASHSTHVSSMDTRIASPVTDSDFLYYMRKKWIGFWYEPELITTSNKKPSRDGLE